MKTLFLSILVLTSTFGANDFYEEVSSVPNHTPDDGNIPDNILFPEPTPVDQTPPQQDMDDVIPGEYKDNPPQDNHQHHSNSETNPYRGSGIVTS